MESIRYVIFFSSNSELYIPLDHHEENLRWKEHTYILYIYTHLYNNYFSRYNSEREISRFTPALFRCEFSSVELCLCQHQGALLSS